MRPPKKFTPHPFEYHQEVELEIDALTNLGSGLGRVDGWVVFVPFCLPGERVRAKIYRNDKNCSHADLVEILRRSEDRVEPRCSLFGLCGGCQYQHLSYEAQLAWKTRQIQELLMHMGGISFPVNACLASEQQWEYRSKITPHFAAPKEGNIQAIGFLATGRRSLLVDVPQCAIALKEINDVLPQVREEVRANASLKKKGATLLLRASNNGIAREAREVARETVSGLQFEFFAGDFFQNNPFILNQFTEYAAQQAVAEGANYLVDAYCGSGLFALSLAKHFQQVIGVEISETSIDWARKNAELNDMDHVQFRVASAEAIFKEVSFSADETCVLIDPPRKGCTPEFLEQLIAFAPARLVYVSCDPATQVRDVKLLQEAGFDLLDVQPFDLFPHTRHIECIMTLKKAQGKDQ